MTTVSISLTASEEIAVTRRMWDDHQPHNDLLFISLGGVQVALSPNRAVVLRDQLTNALTPDQGGVIGDGTEKQDGVA